MMVGLEVLRHIGIGWDERQVVSALRASAEEKRRVLEEAEVEAAKLVGNLQINWSSKSSLVGSRERQSAVDDKESIDSTSDVS